MEIYFDNKAKLTCTHNEVSAEAEVDNFKEEIQFDAYLATNKIPMRWNGKVYVGQMHGMEFTSSGPESHVVNKGRR
jgi:hypothetical protein